MAIADGEELRSSKYRISLEPGSIAFLSEPVKGVPLRGGWLASGSESKSSILDLPWGWPIHDYARSPLVDDGLKDQSGQICDLHAGMDERVKVIHQKNSGMAAARNRRLPVIATRFGGLSECVGQDAAWMIERKNIAENLKQLICYMKDHLDIRKRMAAAAKRQSGQYNESAYYHNLVKAVHEIMVENREMRNGT